MSTDTGNTNPHKSAKADAKAAQAYAKATRPWYKKKRWWLVGFVLIAIIAGALGGGGDEGDDATAKDDSSSQSSDSGKKSMVASQPDEEAESTEEAEPTEEPEPEPKWTTVGKLSGNTNKAGPDFKLNGCDTRMTYRVQGAESTIVAFYVMDSGTQLMEDGGIPVASPTKSGPGETVIRKDEGDYYIEVVAANAEWQVQVQEKC